MAYDKVRVRQQSKEEKIYKKFRESDLDPKDYWNKYAINYEEAMKNDSYHKERLEMIGKLLMHIDMSGADILDFGCGGGIALSLATNFRSKITGIDISEKMIEMAKGNLKNSDSEIVGNFYVGDISSLNSLPDSSFDVVLAINALAYLEKGQDLEFYQHCNRLLRPQGQLVVTHSNELFDMFTLNSYTFAFYERYFLESSRISDFKSLLKNHDRPTMRQFNVRANPLNYAQIMKQFGLEEVQQESCHYHSAPPLILPDNFCESLPNYEEHDKWKFLFTCSIYGSRLVKE